MRKVYNYFEGIKADCISQGRNGTMKTVGVEILNMKDGKVMITPINTKGVVGNCFIEIPKETWIKIAREVAFYG